MVKVIATKEQLEAIGIDYNLTGLPCIIKFRFDDGWVVIIVSHSIGDRQFTNEFDIPKTYLEFMESENTPIERKYVDLVYFGYESEESSRDSELEFIKLIKEKFGDAVILEDAFDNIKGYRQEVYLPEAEHDNYNAWLFGKGFHECSMIMQLLMMSTNEPDKKEEFMKYFNLAKEQYPEAFKPEAL